MGPAKRYYALQDGWVGQKRPILALRNYAMPPMTTDGSIVTEVSFLFKLLIFIYSHMTTDGSTVTEMSFLFKLLFLHYSHVATDGMCPQ